MTKVSPARLAEAPPTTGAHPAVVGRMVQAMQEVTLLLDTTDAATFAADEPWDALAALVCSADMVRRKATPLRPVIQSPT